MGAAGSKSVEPVAAFEVSDGTFSGTVYPFVVTEADVPFELRQQIARRGGCAVPQSVFTDPGLSDEARRFILLSRYPNLERAVSGDFWMSWMSCPLKWGLGMAVYDVCLPQYADRAAFARTAFPIALDKIYGRRQEFMISSEDAAVQAGLESAGFDSDGTVWIRAADYRTPSARRRSRVSRSRAPPSVASKAKAKSKSPQVKRSRPPVALARRARARAPIALAPPSKLARRARARAPIALAPPSKLARRARARAPIALAPSSKQARRARARAPIALAPSSRVKRAIAAGRRRPKPTTVAAATVDVMRKYLRAAVSAEKLRKDFPRGIGAAKRAQLLAYFREHPGHRAQLLKRVKQQ